MCTDVLSTVAEYLCSHDFLHFSLCSKEYAAAAYMCLGRMDVRRRLALSMRACGNAEGLRLFIAAHPPFEAGTFDATFAMGVHRVLYPKFHKYGWCIQMCSGGRKSAMVSRLLPAVAELVDRGFAPAMCTVAKALLWADYRLADLFAEKGRLSCFCIKKGEAREVWRHMAEYIRDNSNLADYLSFESIVCWLVGKGMPLDEFLSSYCKWMEREHIPPEITYEEVVPWEEHEKECCHGCKNGKYTYEDKSENW